MKCQIPNCKNECTKISSAHGIYSGVNLDHLCVHTCGNHSPTEISEYLEQLGKTEAEKLLLCNPFKMYCINENHD